MSRDWASRRALLSTTATALAAGIAGCAGGDGGDGNDGDGNGGGGNAPSRIADYLTSDPAAGNFDGGIADRTGTDEVIVKVGAEGNGGNLAFAPVSLRISAGTTISWQWTGKGSLHNVVSTDASDFDFDSGDPKEEGDPFEQSFDNTGIGLYYCNPHRTVGMKGGFEVVDGS